MRNLTLHHYGFIFISRGHFNCLTFLLEQLKHLILRLQKNNCFFTSSKYLATSLPVKENFQSKQSCGILAKIHWKKETFEVLARKFQRW